MAKAFASQGDLSDKKISFTEIGTGFMPSPPRVTPIPAPSSGNRSSSSHCPPSRPDEVVKTLKPLFQRESLGRLDCFQHNL